MQKIRVILNTTPLLFPKTGIGYYVDNLRHYLSNSENIHLIPSLNNKKIIFLKSLSMLSTIFRKLTGNRQTHLTISIGENILSKVKIRSKQADIYHETFYELIPEGSYKKLVNIYDLSFIIYPDFMEKSLADLLKKRLENLIKVSDFFIVNSNTVKNEVTDLLKIDEDRIAVVPLAPAGKYHRLPRKDRKTIKKVVDSEYILYVGGIHKRKNLDVLIRAFKVINQKYSLKLVICGPRLWHSHELFSLIHELQLNSKVIFTGYVKEETILNLYNHALAFVFPSLYEGFGIPIIEAMACGVPVIASAIPVLKEVAGNGALFFDPHSHDDLISKLEAVIHSSTLRQELITRGLSRSSLFTWQNTGQKTIELYKQCL